MIKRSEKSSGRRRVEERTEEGAGGEVEEEGG